MRTGRMRSLIVWLSLCLVAALSPCLSDCRADFDELIDSPMYQAPDLPAARVEYVLPEKTKALWMKALRRPEEDLNCKAAEAIAEAHRQGVKGLETTVAPLLEVLDRPEQRPYVRLAAARTLVALDAREAAPSFLECARAGDGDLRAAVEPALARWDYRPARAVWLSRLSDPATPPESFLLAVRGLGAVREGEAAAGLLEKVLSDKAPASLRLEAAHALGSMRGDGLEKDAEGLAGDASPRGLVGRLAAAALLHTHRSDGAIRLLRRLAEDPEPAAAAVALRRLVEIDPEWVAAAADRLLASPDAKVRGLAVAALALRPTGERILLLGERLDDANPEVRGSARRSLEQLAAKKEFHDLVIAAATRMLSTQRWRGLEQAVLLLTRLDHKAAAARLVELLAFDRPEVYVTAAWGLRRLAVPETLPGVVKYVTTQQARVRAGASGANAKEIPVGLLDHQFSQLNQFLGRQKYEPADALLRQFIPRMEKPMQSAVCPESRAAAIWALGLIHEGTPDAPLTGALIARLNDAASIPPEDARVRCMCAVSLGRMKANDALASLRAGYSEGQSSLDPLNNACGWAVARLTGEAVPSPKTIQRVRRDWFLVSDE